MLISVYFLSAEYADHHIERVHKSIEKLAKSRKTFKSWVERDFKAELGPGIGIERLCRATHPQRIKQKRRFDEAAADVAEMRGARPNLQKNTWKTIYRTPKGVEKHSRDAEANDMIHMRSGQRSVRARFVIPAPKKERPTKRMR